jgi:hypothetical protein
MDELLKLEKGKLFSSVYLTEQINLFRKAEGNKSKLLHKNVLAKIESEFEEEINGLNIQPVEYLDSKGEKRKCYELTFAEAIQLLMSESKIVRRRIVKVLEDLNDTLKMIMLNDIKRDLNALKKENMPAIKHANTNFLKGIVTGSGRHTYSISEIWEFFSGSWRDMTVNNMRDFDEYLRGSCGISCIDESRPIMQRKYHIY